MSEITKRDLKLFLTLGKYGLLTTSQLSQIVFPGVQSSTVLRRLRALEQENWIYRIDALESGEMVWLLTRRCERKLGMDTLMIRPNRNGVAHDILLTETRMRLESVGLGQNFVPEWSIRRSIYDPQTARRDSGAVVPDGLFSATLWNEEVVTVALELELHAKNGARYERVFRRYQEQRQVGLLWYFVRSESLGHALQRQWRAVQRRWILNRDHLIFTVNDDFRKNGRDALIYFLDGKTGLTAQLFSLPKAETSSATSAQPVGTQNGAETLDETMQNAS